MNGLNNIPRPLLVLIVFLVGIGLIVYGNRPHNICDTQIESFQELQIGWLTPAPIKGGGKKPPIYDRALKACRQGMGSAGACLEYFKLLNKVANDLEPVAASCAEFVDEVPVIRKVLSEGIRTLVNIAWGEELPDKDAKISGRLDSTELALFCRLRATYLKYFGRDALEAFKNSVLSDLSTKKYELDKDGKRVCSNCEMPPKLLELMGGRDETLKRTIFSLNCQTYF